MVHNHTSQEILVFFFEVMKQRDTSQASAHCVKSVQIRSYFWSVFSPNTGIYGAEITPYLDTSQASSMEPQMTNKTHQNDARVWPSSLNQENDTRE